MKKQKLSALLLAAVMATGIIAGCSSTSSSTSVATETSSTAQSSTSVVANTSAEDLTVDVLVIGAGGAGMSAAMQAVQDGATNVLIIEKMPITGGNTVRATGGINAAETKLQEEMGIEDSVELFVSDTMTGGKEMNDEELVTVMAENSSDAIDWLIDLGADIGDVGMSGGASVKRIHRPEDGSAIGPVVLSTLSENLEANNVPILLETTAKHIVLDDNGAVSAVEVEGPDGDYTIYCTAVVLATGGFGASQEMVVKYNENYAGFSTTNHSGATGDGIVMAEEVGAALVDIEQIQTHPTVNPDTSTMYTEGVRGDGAILVNVNGERFVNEMETRDVVSAAILAQPEEYCWLVFDETVRGNVAAIETYISAGLVEEADTVAGLAEKIGVDAATLEATISSYSGYVSAGEDADFGRNTDSMVTDFTTPNYYAAKCVPAIHHTMGGVKINTETQVLNDAGEAIPGLFAAGEVTGGVHGGNRIGGNAVTDIVVFGRIAGTSAEEYVLANGGNTESTIVVETQQDAVPEVQGDYTDGVYTGTGKGNNGDITVEVVVEGGNIVSITLVEHAETVGIYEAAEKAVVNEIIRTQTVDGIDVVAGATNSSNGIMQAVTAALADAQAADAAA